MTNPVVLYGTQSNGETLPVQVDATGRLVAEGLQGPEGPPGPIGPPGPDGIVLPPDPYEGALLGWLDGGLAWVSSGAIPIPEGVFGPITAWDAESSYLEVEGSIPNTVGTGVYVYQCEQNGEFYTEGWNVSQRWSLSGDDQTLTGGSWGFVFDGDAPSQITTANAAFKAQGGTATYTFPVGVSGNIQIYASTGHPTEGGSAITLSDGSSLAINGGTSGVAWYDFGYKTGITSFTLNEPNDTNGTVVGAVRANNVLLVDNNKSLSLRVNQTFGNALIGTAVGDAAFTVGKYLYVPPQRVAPWVLYGNDPTSLIDHLRQTRD